MLPESTQGEQNGYNIMAIVKLLLKIFLFARSKHILSSLSRCKCTKKKKIYFPDQFIPLLLLNQTFHFGHSHRIKLPIRRGESQSLNSPSDKKT